MSEIPKIGPVKGLEELPGLDAPRRTGGGGAGFGDVLRDALSKVDALQRESEAAQVSFARGDNVDLHDVLIKVEEAEVAFKTMMEVRNRLVDAYQQIMRMS